jgi:hypothetical protein
MAHPLDLLFWISNLSWKPFPVCFLIFSPRCANFFLPTILQSELLVVIIGEEMVRDLDQFSFQKNKIIFDIEFSYFNP